MEKRILIVDDSMFVTNMVTKILEGHGYKVMAMQSPFGIIKAVREFRPGLVLMDYNIPGLKGDHIVEILQKKDLDADHGTVFYSASEDRIMAEVVKKTGALGFIRKDTQPEGLVSEVERFWKMYEEKSLAA